MNRLLFALGMPLLFFMSCSRDAERTPRYDPHQCPFCVMEKGACAYCSGTKKCTFCKGTATRRVVTGDRLNERIQKTTVDEPCLYCNATGVCRHCNGTGSCWACDGTGRVESWNFYEKSNRNSREHEK